MVWDFGSFFYYKLTLSSASSARSSASMTRCSSSESYNKKEKKEIKYLSETKCNRFCINFIVVRNHMPVGKRIHRKTVVCLGWAAMFFSRDANIDR